jgi:hypothetical protein
MLTNTGEDKDLSAKLPNIPFHENPIRGSLVVTYGRTDTAKVMGVFL